VIKIESFAILGWPSLLFASDVVGSVDAGTGGCSGFGWAGLDTLGILIGNWAGVI